MYKLSQIRQLSSLARFSSAATLALVTLTSSCTPISTHLTAQSSQTSSNCTPIDPFIKAINKATNSTTLAQSAESPADWDLVVVGWLEAIAAMESVPVDNPKRAFAQKKVAEYYRNLNIARQRAKNNTPALSFPSFNNPIFEEQILLYLSYIAAVGPPDILIVGSSRALVGIDSQQLQQALYKQGKGNLKVFNFSVNGATAQFVDFQLRQLLTPEELPQLIIWADGVRAFNSGRGDRTFTSLTKSPGYQEIIAGNRPELPEGESITIDPCEDISGASISGNENLVAGDNSVAGKMPALRMIKLEKGDGESEAGLLMAKKNNSYSGTAIDANGFLPLDNKFNPKIYYQHNPRVSGSYDADYEPFSFSGEQAVALDRVKAFASEKQIPLVIVNLPLTRDYLDSVRLAREKQFRQLMESQSASGEFVFINLVQEWENQNQYFTDPSHLNRYGAAAVANFLATQSSIPWPRVKVSKLS